ncbi:transcriptional regulator [mine drainage metagenome]|uniref:Transcriptional regulator n=1 Tax=mine drainage metagenome TaxID=410659 RepID=T1BAI9_9ZZZZ
MKYIEDVRDRFSGTSFPVFTIEDARLALKGKNVGNGYLSLMLHNMSRSGEITRITRGVYTFHKDVVVAGFAFRPFYYGMESALALRGLSDQGTNLVVMTARNVRTGTRSFEGRNYRIQRIGKDLMFGYGVIKRGGYWIPVSEPEKTIIDMVSLGQHVSEPVRKALKKIVDRKKLVSYLKSYGNPVAAKTMEVLDMKRL